LYKRHLLEIRSLVLLSRMAGSRRGAQAKTDPPYKTSPLLMKGRQDHPQVIVQDCQLLRNPHLLRQECSYSHREGSCSRNGMPVPQISFLPLLRGVGRRRRGGVCFFVRAARQPLHESGAVRFREIVQSGPNQTSSSD